MLLPSESDTYGAYVQGQDIKRYNFKRKQNLRNVTILLAFADEKMLALVNTGKHIKAILSLPRDR